MNPDEQNEDQTLDELLASLEEKAEAPPDEGVRPLTADEVKAMMDANNAQLLDEIKGVLPIPAPVEEKPAEQPPANTLPPEVLFDQMQQLREDILDELAPMYPNWSPAVAKAIKADMVKLWPQLTQLQQAKAAGFHTKVADSVVKEMERTGKLGIAPAAGGGISAPVHTEAPPPQRINKIDEEKIGRVQRIIDDLYEGGIKLDKDDFAAANRYREIHGMTDTMGGN